MLEEKEPDEATTSIRNRLTIHNERRPQENESNLQSPMAASVQNQNGHNKEEVLPRRYLEALEIMNMHTRMPWNN